MSIKKVGEKMATNKQVKVDLTRLHQLTNSVYVPLYDNKSRFLVLYGGAGSGKSVFAAQKIVVRMLSEKTHKFLVVRKVANTLRNSVYALIKEVIDQWGLTKLFTINKTDMEITCVNGNKIIFAGLDDVEKLKSIAGITGIWMEEASEMIQEDLQQLNLRLRGQTVNYKQIIISFNPISVVHWLKTYFFDSPKDNATVLKTTYKDNEFIDDEYKKELESYLDTDPYWYMVYALGEWGVMGKTVFNAQLVTDRLIRVRDKKPIRGTFVFKYENQMIVDNSIRFVEDENGELTIYEKPIAGVPYVIGGDISEGGIDYSVGQVRNNLTWNQAAVWRGQVDTDIYSKQMYCLGKYYNEALIGIEINFDLHPVKELQRLGYYNQYIRETMDSYTEQTQKKYGFRTDRVTRPVIIANYVALVRDHIDSFNDVATLEEMLTFVRNENGKPEAQKGKHDDTILADCICLEIRSQQISRFADPTDTNALSHYSNDQQHLPFALQDNEDDNVSWHDL
jgi:phage terminase large subunit